MLEAKPLLVSLRATAARRTLENEDYPVVRQLRSLESFGQPPRRARLVAPPAVGSATHDVRAVDDEDVHLASLRIGVCLSRNLRPWFSQLPIAKGERYPPAGTKNAPDPQGARLRLAPWHTAGWIPYRGANVDALTRRNVARAVPSGEPLGQLLAHDDERALVPRLARSPYMAILRRLVPASGTATVRESQHVRVEGGSVS